MRADVINPRHFKNGAGATSCVCHVEGAPIEQEEEEEQEEQETRNAKTCRAVALSEGGRLQPHKTGETYSFMMLTNRSL
jgi:hypothetical protein